MRPSISRSHNGRQLQGAVGVNTQGPRGPGPLSVRNPILFCQSYICQNGFRAKNSGGFKSYQVNKQKNSHKFEINCVSVKEGRKEGVLKHCVKQSNRIMAIYKQSGSKERVEQLHMRSKLGPSLDYTTPCRRRCTE